MASKITEVAPTIREVTFKTDKGEFTVNVNIDKDGITATRKGDKHRDKPSVGLSWAELMLLGAENAGVNFYEHLGFEDKQ